MDAVDIRILRTMGIYPFLNWPHPPQSLKANFIAKQVGRSFEAVKDRIAALEKSGIIAGYELFPNLRHFEMRVLTFHFRVPDPARKTRAVEAARQMNGVMGSWDYQGSTVCLELGFRDSAELDRRLREIAHHMQAENIPHACFQYDMPPVSRPLTRLDWRIMGALRPSARRSMQDVAKELRVSERTVKRHFERMARDGSFDVFAQVNPARITGHVFCVANVSFVLGSKVVDAGRVLKAVDGKCWGSWKAPDPGHPGLSLMLVAVSLAEVEELRRRLESIPGVRAAEILVPSGASKRMEWIDEEIRRRASLPKAEARAMEEPLAA